MYNLYFIGYEMSKVTKLINSPDKFFKDLLIKRMNSFGIEIKNIDISAPSENVNKINFDFNSLENPNIISTIIHCGESYSSGKLMVEFWLKYLNKYKDKFVFLIRNKELFDGIRFKYKEFNIVYAKLPTDVECLLSRLDKLENICFISNTANNIHLLRFNEYKHTYIGNFDAKRQSSFHKYFRVYDECWVYSQDLYNRIIDAIDVRHLNVKLINPPNLIMKNTNNNENIVYWALNSEDTIYSSFSLLNEIFDIEELKGKFLNIFTSFEMKDSVSNHINNYRIKCFDDLFLLEICDLIIMDFNYVKILEALKCGVPVIVYLPNHIFEFNEDELRVLNLCYQFSNINEIQSIIKKLNDGEDALYPERLKFLSFSYGVAPIESHNFNNILHQLFMGG